MTVDEPHDDANEDARWRILERVEAFLREGIWDIDFRQHGGVRRLMLRQLQVSLIAFKGMRDDEVRLRAASLSLITLLSVVPFLAVVFWVFQAFGGVEDLRSRVEPFIYENLAVGAQEEAIAWLNRFIDQIHTGAVGGIGTAILIVTAIGLLGSMEESFNRVWGVRRGRPWLNRFVIYWCLLTVGPILLAASLAGTATVTGWLPWSSGISSVLLRLVPMGVMIGAFTLIYVVVPHTRVGINHALVGGIAAGTLFELAKFAYAWVAGNLFQHHAIYGSLGSVPVFIIWVNITWVIVLFGCELTFANQNVGTLRHEERSRAASQQLREQVAGRLMLEVAIDFYRGAPPPTASELSSRLDVPIRLVQDLLETLRAGGLLLEAAGNRSDFGFAPARVISSLTLKDVVWAMRMRQASTGIDLSDDDRQKLLRVVLAEADELASAVYDRSNYLMLARRALGESDCEARPRASVSGPSRLSDEDLAPKDCAEDRRPTSTRAIEG